MLLLMLWCYPGVTTFFGYRARRELDKVILKWRNKGRVLVSCSGGLGIATRVGKVLGRVKVHYTKGGWRRIKSGQRRIVAELLQVVMTQPQKQDTQPRLAIYSTSSILGFARSFVFRSGFTFNPFNLHSRPNLTSPASCSLERLHSFAM